MNEKQYVQKIKDNYLEKETTKLDELKSLDKKVNLPVAVFAYCFGVIGTLVLGFGMCIAMKVILEDYMWVGILIGCIGILLVSINYPIYLTFLNKRKRKYKTQIIEISDELLNE